MQVRGKQQKIYIQSFNWLSFPGLFQLQHTQRSMPWMRRLTALHHCGLKGDITFSGKKTCSSKYSLGEKWSPIVPYSILFKNFYWSRVAFNPVLLSLCVCVCVCSVAQLCLTLRNPMECSPPGSSVHKIFQARKLEWVAILPSRRSSQPRDQTRVSCVDRCFFPLSPGNPCISFCCKTKWISYMYTYIHSFFNSLFISVTTEKSVEFLVLFNRFSSAVYFIHSSVYMSVPTSQFIPPPPLFPPLVFICLFSMPVSLLASLQIGLSAPFF